MKRIGIFLKFFLCSVFAFLIGALCMVKKAGSVIGEKERNSEKFRKLFLVSCVWIRQKQQGKSMEVFLNRNAYHSVAIYGMGNIGRLLEKELEGCAEIRYGIDRNEISVQFPMYKPEDHLPEVDMVIVTPAYEFEEIEEMLKKKLNCPIYSIEDVIYFMG